MRKVIDLQMGFWRKDIADIEFDPLSRDEIPKLLIGLQYIYTTPTIRERVFDVLRGIVPRETQETGRPGMDLWKILVLGTLRTNCNFDYDKVQEMANNHRKLRQMLGHSKKDLDCQYALQTIKDNLPLLRPEMLDQINQIVVRAGHRIVTGKKNPELRGSCDSFVVETDVHFPTDVNLLFDAIRKMIGLIGIICSEIGISEWRQSHHNIQKVKGLLRGIQRLKRSTSKDETKKAQRDQLIVDEHRNYIDVCRGTVSRVEETICILRELGLLSVTQDFRLGAIQEYIAHAERQIDQIVRRVVLDEKIPHEEKVFSIFEPHTEWISKGKAGVRQELGLGVCVLKDVSLR
jgi:IS5 family transposase